MELFDSDESAVSSSETNYLELLMFEKDSSRKNVVILSASTVDHLISLLLVPESGTISVSKLDN